MSYRNTMKLFASNFTLVWKQVLYFLICFFIFAPLTWVFAEPIVDVLRHGGISHEVESVIYNIYTPEFNETYTITGIIRNSLHLIGENFVKLLPNLALVFLFGFLLPYIFMQIGTLNVSSIIYKKLSMNLSEGYTQNLIKTLRISLPYALMNIIFSLPFWSLTIVLAEVYLFFANGGFMTLLCLALLSFCTIIISAVKYTFFSCYTAYIVEHECSPLTAFIAAFPLSLRNFWNTVASSIVFHITVFVANCFIIIFTFFAGAILMMPATIVCTAIFFVVTYLNKTGQRYYLGNNYIYNPVKYTVKKDEYADKMCDPEEPIEEQFVTSVTSLNNQKHKQKNNK